MILYECITGQVPFSAETFNELLFRIVLESPPPAESFVPDLSPEMAALTKARARMADWAKRAAVLKRLPVRYRREDYLAPRELGLGDRLRAFSDVRGLDVDVLHDRIDTWTDQIEDAVFEDEHKPFSDNVYEDQVEVLRDYVEDRAVFLADWLKCWQEGGQANPEGYCLQY